MAALYLAPLALDTPLTDPDEGIHATIAQEMRDGHDLIVPRFIGRPFLDKPILYFWAQTASLAAFGDSAAAVRLPGLLFAILGVATTGWLAALLFDASVGWIAAVCYATLALPWALAQAPVHDIALVPLVNLALGAFWGADADDTPEFRRWACALMAGLALGLSILTKGFGGVAIVGIAFGVYLLIARRLTLRLVVRGAAAVIFAIGVAAPWYAAMEMRQPGYLQYFLVARHVLGFVGDEQPHGGRPLWYYVPALVGGGLPWLLYLGRVRDVGAPVQTRRPRLLLWTWLVGAFVFLSLGQSKLTTYILPAFPAIAILAACRWSAALSEGGERASVGTAARIHALLFGAVALALPLAGRRIGIPIGAAGIAASGLLAVAWAWIWWRVRDARRLGSTWPQAAAATAATWGLILVLFASPAASAYSALDLATYLNAQRDLPRTIYVVDERIGSVVFYLRPDLRPRLTPDRMRPIGADDVQTLRTEKGDVIAVRQDEAERVTRQLAGRDVRRQPAGRYLVFVVK